MKGRRNLHPPHQKKGKNSGNTRWKTAALLVCAFVAVAYFAIYGATILNPSNFQNVSPDDQGPDYRVSHNQSNYPVGSIATDASGSRGYAIVNDDGKGQYQVVQVYPDQSKTGWHTNGPEKREWLNYEIVVRQNPVIWSGGLIDITHIPDKDLSLAENRSSGNGT
jgi:hypothetical protein